MKHQEKALKKEEKKDKKLAKHPKIEKPEKKEKVAKKIVAGLKKQKKGKAELLALVQTLS